MPRIYNLLGISGSLREGSYSTAVLKALVEASTGEARYDFAEIGVIPHFNQDLLTDPWPKSAHRLRHQIAIADGIVISSPEYNHGMPGVLKNAMDWASRPHNQSPLRNKPVLIITSSPAFTGGVRAQAQIRETLVSALARPVNTPEIVVGLVASKMVNGKFQDAATLEFMRIGFSAMTSQIDQNAEFAL